MQSCSDGFATVTQVAAELLNMFLVHAYLTFHSLCQWLPHRIGLQADCDEIDNIRLVVDKLTQVHEVSKHVLLISFFTCS